MNLSNLLPPSDLLNHVRDVEKGLRQRKRLSSVGWIGFLIASGAQIALEVTTGSQWKSGDNLIQFARTGWPYLIPVFLAVICFLLATWSTFWLQETRLPFRYTCCVDAFVNINGMVDGNLIDKRLKWLPHDLKQLLNQRVARFRFLEQPQSGGKASKEDDTEERPWPDAHISIYGHYVVRRSSSAPPQALAGGSLEEIEIMPAVRIGPSDNPASLALPPPPLPLSKPDDLERTEYDNLLELAYNSIVTEVYRQLKEDVQRKIELLPTRRLQAMALFNEAEDYARSNALRAYEEARDLYQQAASLIDPVWRPLAESGVWRRWGLFQRRWFRIRAWGRRVESRIRPGAASIDVLCARGEIGYARMLLFRRVLAVLAGAADNAVFEARGRAARALARLEPLEASVPGSTEALFDTHVTLAFALDLMGDSSSPEHHLKMAEQLDPKRATADPLFVFARSRVTGRGEGRLGLLRRALDLQPRSEVVGFEFAVEMEQQWRSGDDLDPRLAELVLHEYGQLLRINPNNLAAWANSGYVHWLLGTPKHLEEAGKRFNRGRSFKTIRRDASVAEVDYGLCRLCCETGDFAQAYEHCRAAFFDVFSQGLVRRDQEFRSYYFSVPGAATLNRFRRYGAKALLGLRKARFTERTGTITDPERARLGSPETRRMLTAFVLNDVGEAHLHSSGEKHRATAHRLIRRAVRLSETHPLVRFNESLLLSNDEAIKSLEIVREHAPLWVEGLGELAVVYGRAVIEKLTEAKRLTSREKKLEEEDLPKAKEKLASLERQARMQMAPGPVAAPQSPSPSDRRQANAPAKVSGGAVPALDKPLAEVRAEIEKIQGDIQHERSSAAEAKTHGDKLSAEAGQLARFLLPNAWLWRKEGDNEEFDWSSLRNPIYRDEQRWERDLDDLQVRALYSWVQPQLRLLTPKRAETSPPPKADAGSLTSGLQQLIHAQVRTIDPQARSETANRQHVIDLLEYIRQHFWPQNPGLLWELDRLDGTESSRQRIVNPIREKLKQSPTDLSTLHRLSAPYFDINERIKWVGAALDKQPDNRDLADLFAKVLMAAAKEEAAKEEPATPELCRLHDFAKKRLPKHAECHGVFAGLFLDRYWENEGDGSLRDRAIDALKRCAADPRKGDGGRRRDLERLQLKKRNIDRKESVEKRFGSLAATHNPGVSPLAIEFSPDLASLVEGDAQSDADTVLRDLEFGLRYELGVLFPRPELRLARETTAANRYTIFLDGVPLVGHDLFLERWFFPVPPERLTDAGIPAERVTNPANGNPGSWVAQPHWKAAEKFAMDQDVYFWRPFAFTVLHIAAVCRMNAAEFLDINKTDVHLSDPVVARRLRDSSAERIRQNNQLQPLTNVLRALLAEQFPIRELQSIIDVFESTFDRTQNLVEVCEAIRSHPSLKRENPFLSKKGCYFTVSRDFEREIENGLVNGNHRVFAVEPQVCQELLAAVRNAVQSFGSDIPWPTSLVSSAPLRPWIRRLVELEFPHLPVLAEGDVIPEFADRIRGSFDRKGNLAWFK